MRLESKRALVTGAGTGIGRATAVRLSEEGACVAVTGRRADRLAETAAAVRATGRVAVVVVADHTRTEDNERVVERAVGELGGLDILINSAGIIGNDGILEPKPDEWRRIMDTNVEAVYDLTRRAVPELVKGQSSAIVNVSSVCSYRPFVGILAYCVSKAALDMFTQCLALELAPKGVRVNAINPGVVVSELHTASGMVADYDAFLERAKTTHPLGRVGQPEEIAALAAFLASDEAGWTTGGIHPIDGGRGLTAAR